MMAPSSLSHFATLYNWNVHLLEALDICGGAGALEAVVHVEG